MRAKSVTRPRQRGICDVHIYKSNKVGMRELCKRRETGQRQYKAIQPQNLLDVFEQDQKHYTLKMYTRQLYTRWLNS